MSSDLDQPCRTSLLRSRMVAVLAAVTLPMLVGTGTARAATAADWQKLAMCESGGNWSINTGNGFYGGLQFTSQTWLAFGGGGYASRADFATPEQQMAIANRVLAVQGWNAWPACSRATGLYGTPTSPPPQLVIGAILAHYSALGGAGGFLGAPLTAELGTPIRAGRYNHFQGGSIYWSPGTGAWSVHGAIRDAWSAIGWENSLLGFPVSDEIALRGGAYNAFEGGALYWTPVAGAHEVHGAIRGAYARFGNENGPLGYPVTSETRTPSKIGAFNHFQGGSIYWSPTTGAQEVIGAIRARWASLGWENSALGFPTSDEFAVPGGRRSNFQGGWITWTPAGGTVVHLGP